MLKKDLFTVFVLLIAGLSGILRAQVPDNIFARLESKKTGPGSVKIIQDSKIRDFINLHLNNQNKMNGIKGYRISIYFGSGQEAKKNADLAVARFISKYEDVKSYRRFEYPYFKVYVGDFRTKSEALRFQKIIENDYPDSFIREDIISFPD
jgi:hypothetical protein